MLYDEYALCAPSSLLDIKDRLATELSHLKAIKAHVITFFLLKFPKDTPSLITWQCLQGVRVPSVMSNSLQPYGL